MEEGRIMLTVTTESGNTLKLNQIQCTRTQKNTATN